MMVLSRKFKAFTILELMVSIFITITVIASFYKLYESSVKTERSSSIRVSVNLLGEQIIDSIASSIQMIALNSQKGDLADTSDTGMFRKLTGISGATGKAEFTYLSPYGSPITKVASQPSATSKFSDEACKTITLFNSAAFHKDVKKFYFHTQFGIIVTNDQTTVSIGESRITLKVSGFETDTTLLADKDCRDVFPAGTLVTGEDSVFTLTYEKASAGDTANHLKLWYEDKDKNEGTGGGTGETEPKKTYLVDFNYSPTGANNVYSMPRFMLEFLQESKDADGNFSRSWVTTVDSTSAVEVNKITAVRFGFVVLSKKDRVYAEGGSQTGEASSMPSYCIFDESDCYTLPSLNYTASVFRRVVYLANYRLLKDANM